MIYLRRFPSHPGPYPHEETGGRKQNDKYNKQHEKILTFLEEESEVTGQDHKNYIKCRNIFSDKFKISREFIVDPVNNRAGTQKPPEQVVDTKHEEQNTMMIEQTVVYGDIEAERQTQYQQDS